MVQVCSHGDEQDNENDGLVGEYLGHDQDSNRPKLTL